MKGTYAKNTDGGRDEDEDQSLALSCIDGNETVKGSKYGESQWMNGCSDDV